MINLAVKKVVAERAKYCCEYCFASVDFSSDSFSIDHIIPAAITDNDDASNLAYSCLGCNNFKYTATKALDPLTQSIVPLYNPRDDSWNDHFRWSENYTIIEGISPTGRATVSRLNLNRPGLINLRRVLKLFGHHPPGWI
jgi:hypothetical protein